MTAVACGRIYAEGYGSVVWAILTRGVHDEACLVGGDGERDGIAVMRGILRGMGAEDAFDWVRRRPGHDRRYAIDSAKLRRKLGWAHGHIGWLTS